VKIAYLSDSTIPSRTANSVHVMKMCQAFAKNGHEVVLFARRSEEQVGDEYSYYGVDPCFDIEKQTWPSIWIVGHWLYTQQVKRHILRKPLPDIFYGREPYSLLEVASTGRPLVYDAHISPVKWIHQYLEARVLRCKNLKCLVVNCDALRKEYLRLFPWMNKDRVLVAHNGAELPEPSKVANEDLAWPGRNRCPQVGYVGHLYSGKGMEVIVPLAACLPELDFHVIGGTRKDIEYWKIRSDIENLFFHGFIPNGLLGKYYNHLDILLAPYQKQVAGSEGGDLGKWMSPLKIFEYMAYAKAIVASDIPVLREVLCHGVNSLLCPPQDIEAWQTALLDLANNPGLRTALGDTAHREFLTCHTWKSRAEAVLLNLEKGG
jgi:glycosyltransferase involved in cell wall biosynthesis